MLLNSILKRFEVVSSQNGNYKCICPAHDDHKPSLNIKEDKSNGNILINCFAGCKTDDILSKVGLLPKDLFNNSKQKKESRLYY